MSRNLSVTEPHPSVPTRGAYIGGGRGGAGNFRRYKAEDLTTGPDAVGPASRVSLAKPFKRQSTLLSGRGGAGNMFKPVESEERVFQFDEEMLRRRESQAPVYHIGRGGVGNLRSEATDERKPRTERLNSTASSSSGGSSDSTASNVRRSIEGAVSRISRRF